MNKIKTKRKKLGYKQYKIAERLGISTRHYARIENDERMAKDEEINLLSNIFNCSSDELRERGEF